MTELEARGINGQLKFDGSTVWISREGFVGRTTHGRSAKSLAVKSIGSVQFRAATTLVNGFIQFAVSGESSQRSIGRDKKKDAAKDENAIVFRKSASADFEAIRDAILKAQSAPAAAAAPAEPDIADQIAKLAALRDGGVLSADEFDAKKAELLARM